ncbi:MAG: transposase [Methanomassiliicoccus sp.]|nr:transposase [Methanomassiliicoccus sp.]
MIRNYEYRLYPSRKQLDKLYSTFRLCSELYNLLLAEHEAAYEQTGVSLTWYDLNNLITNVKRHDARFKSVYSLVLQDQADRLSKAFSNFYRRCHEKKQGKCVKVGYPRYKKLIHSITYPQNNGAFKVVGNKLKVSRIGKIPIVLHRPIIGTMKALTIKRNRAGQWFAVFCCEIENQEPKLHPGPTVGLDQGLNHIVVEADGTVIEPPKFLRKSEKRLAKEQRKLSRKEKGSNNRRRQRHKVARVHLKIANQRGDFLHQLSRELAEKYSVIVIEELQIHNMVKNHSIAKSFYDAGLSSFISMLEHKVSETGARLIKVSAAYTTQTCSRCGHVKEGDEKLGLGDREYRCSCCGLVIDRDLNASMNIHRAGQARIHACGDDVRPSLSKAVVAEPGTTRSGGLA